jgi:DNA-binding NarL/FixJ family response regulator
VNAVATAGSNLRSTCLRICVVAEACNSRKLVDRIDPAGADVYILDVVMTLLNGIEATRELLRRSPDSRVIMLSFQTSGSVVGEALRAGARGPSPRRLRRGAWWRRFRRFTPGATTSAAT